MHCVQALQQHEHRQSSTVPIKLDGMLSRLRREQRGQCVSEARSLPFPSPRMIRAVACVEGAGRAHAEQPRGEGGGGEREARAGAVNGAGEETAGGRGGGGGGGARTS